MSLLGRHLSLADIRAVLPSCIILLQLYGHIIISFSRLSVRNKFYDIETASTF